MKNHTKIYLKAFGYNPGDNTDFIPSELSGQRAVDIHHIVTREDRIENLMALTREEHIKYGEIKSEMRYLLINHRNFIDVHDLEYDKEWFNKYLSKYAQD